MIKTIKAVSVLKKSLSPIINSILIMVVSITLFTSCNSNVFFDKNTEIENNSWDMNDRKSFAVNVSEKDLNNTYSFALNLRHTNDYKYNNIYFFITTIYPDRSVTRNDTVCCILAYPDGTWKGKGHTDIKDNRFWFAKNVKFGQKGEYIFKIQQATLDTILSGVKEIGLHIEKQTE